MTDSLAERRDPEGPAGDSPLTYALNLGWRIAHLYALTDDFDAPLEDTLLPLHHSLACDDQPELQVLAAASDARRAEIPGAIVVFPAGQGHTGLFAPRSNAIRLDRSLLVHCQPLRM